MTRVGEWRASGKTAADFCEGREYLASTLRFWSSHLNCTKSGQRSVQSTTQLRMARVQVERPPAAEAPELIIELRGARVAVARGADTVTLMMVLEAIGEIGVGNG